MFKYKCFETFDDPSLKVKGQDPQFSWAKLNLVPRACDPLEGTRGSGIIRCRKPGILAKIELRIHFNGQSDSSLKRIIPEPRVPSRGSQARGTRLGQSCDRPTSFPGLQCEDEARHEEALVWAGQFCILIG